MDENRSTSNLLSHDTSEIAMAVGSARVVVITTSLRTVAGAAVKDSVASPAQVLVDKVVLPLP